MRLSRRRRSQGQGERWREGERGERTTNRMDEAEQKDERRDEIVEERAHGQECEDEEGGSIRKKA